MQGHTLTSRQKVIAGTVGAVLLLILFFVLCFRTVGAGQVGIITRFGDVSRTASSGPVVKLPWPIERLRKMDIQIQKEEQKSNAATSDLQDVQATLALNYAIDSATAIRIYKEIGPDFKERVIIPAVQESFKSASAKYTAQQLITERSKVKDDAYGVIRQRLEKYNIRVVELNIVNFSFGPEFAKAIEAVQVANQNVAKARQELETVKVEAEKTVTAANASAESQRLQQQTLTPEVLQKLAIDKWDGKMPVYQGVQGGVFNIPVQGS